MTVARRSAALGLAIGLFLVPGSSAQLVSSDFSDGPQGWTTEGNSDFQPYWHPGLITQQDISSSIMAYCAPSSYHGDLSAAIGGELTFEIMTSAEQFAPSTPRVRISGQTSSGVQTMLIRLATPRPAQTFVPYSVPMDPGAGWYMSTGSGAPSAQVFREILSNVTDFRLIGDTLSQNDEWFTIADVALHAPEPSGPTVVDIYILAGQSNMAGCDDVRAVDASWSAPNDDVMLYWGNRNAPTFTALVTGTSGASCSAPAPAYYYGPELGFGNDVCTAMPDRQVVIIKYAVGGSSLFSDWTTPTGEYPSGGELWNGLRTVIADATFELEGMGYDYRFAGFLWMQGESDADKRYRARYYAENLESFIASMRDYVGEPEMPFILGRIRNAGQPHAELVRQSQFAVANADPNAYWIDTDDLLMQPDGLHYDEYSMIELGRRFADIVLCLP